MNLALFATATTSDATLKMSSLEIADLVKSRHDDVKRSIERLTNKGAIVQPPTADEHSTDSMGRSRTTQVYIFSGHQGRNCTCTPPQPPSLYPPFLSGFFFGAAAALTFAYLLLP